MSDSVAIGRGHSLRTLAAGTVGNVIEWYDFTLYGYLAVILSDLFFPHDDKAVSLIATYGVFAAGFLMRPLGGLVFGHLGDTLGRKTVLVTSVLMMVIPTLLLGMLPTYAAWGIWAPLALTAIRMLQGLSTGGEFSGSVTYLVETAPDRQRGFAGSWANFGSAIGMLLGAATPAAVIWILGQEETQAWGWRIPFLLGGVLGIAALLLRRGLPEAPVSEHEIESREGDHPLKRALREESGTLLRVFLFCCGYGVVFYIPLVFLPSWLALYTPISLHHALFLATLGLAAQAVIVPLLAIASDRWIRRTHFLGLGFTVMALVVLPLFALAGEGQLWQAALVLMIFSLLIAVPLAVVPTTLAEAFDRGHRLTGYAVSFNLGISLIGGTAPMVATFAIKATGHPLAPAVYVIVLALVGAAAILSLKDRSREPLR